MAVVSLFLLTTVLLRAEDSIGMEFSRPEFGLEYVAELQSDLQGAAKSVMYLHMAASLPMDRFAFFDVSTISVVTSDERPLLPDLQGFSNIDAENVPLVLAVLGVRFPFSKSANSQMFFVGIRNVNEDYFVSPVTAFFANSSCGIFPTLSANADIANYPFAAPCLHYRLLAPRWRLTASLYNGLGHRGFTGEQSVFRLRPHADGIFAIVQGEYRYPSVSSVASLFAGTCLHVSESQMAALWAYLEQPVSPHLTLIADVSHAFGSQLACTDFAGLGGLLRLKHSSWGLFADYARFCQTADQPLAPPTTIHEFATELTARIQLSDWSYLAPSAHLITTGGHCRPAFALRFGLCY